MSTMTPGDIVPAAPSSPPRGLILAAGEIDLAERVIVRSRSKVRIKVARRSILIRFASEEDVRRALRDGRAEFGWPRDGEAAP